MGQPKAGTPATIAQVPGKALIELVDRGNWFTQDDGNAHLDRTALQWERLWNGAWERVSAAVPAEKRTLWEQIHKSEIPLVRGKWTSVLAVGPENVGVKFRALVMAGYGPSTDAGKVWVEWGALSGDDSGRVVYSNTITVQPWGTTPPPPTAPRPFSTVETKARMVNLAKRWESGQAQEPKLSRIRIAREILETTDADWLPMREGMRALLDGNDEDDEDEV